MGRFILTRKEGCHWLLISQGKEGKGNGTRCGNGGRFHYLGESYLISCLVNERIPRGEGSVRHTAVSQITKTRTPTAKNGNSEGRSNSVPREKLLFQIVFADRQQTPQATSQDAESGVSGRNR